MKKIGAIKPGKEPVTYDRAWSIESVVEATPAALCAKNP